MSVSIDRINKEEYTILIVDDDDIIVDENTDLLKKEGYRVFQAMNGREAVEIVKNEQVDLMLLDFFMPGFTGEQVVKAIREFNNEVVIILQTGYAGEKPPLEMLELLNIQGYHDKTEGMEKLLLWVASGINSCSLMRENKRMFEEITLAQQTIKSIKENQEKLIEQERLASLGEMMGSISENMANRMECISNTRIILDKLTENLSKALNQVGINDETCTNLANTIAGQVAKLKEFCEGMQKALNTVGTQAREMKQEACGQKFTIDILMRSINIMIEEELIRANCTMKSEIDIDMHAEIQGKYSDLMYVITNIIKNAIDAYEGKGGEVKLQVEKNNDNIKFSIKDYGKGISENVKKGIFKGAVTTKGMEAAGLGLYVAGIIVKGRFGGRIWFESEEGKGTTFYIAVPLLLEVH
ncbi:MAG: ATP-binding protein [Deltaproteobacteria bacterium]